MSPEQRAAMAGNRQALADYAGTAMSDKSLRDRLGRVSLAGVWVLWGDSDRIVDPEYGRAFAAAIPGAEFPAALRYRARAEQIESPGPAASARSGSSRAPAPSASRWSLRPKRPGSRWPRSAPERFLQRGLGCGRSCPWPGPRSGGCPAWAAQSQIHCRQVYFLARGRGSPRTRALFQPDLDRGDALVLRPGHPSHRGGLPGLERGKLQLGTSIGHWVLFGACSSQPLSTQ